MNKLLIKMTSMISMLAVTITLFAGCGKDAAKTGGSQGSTQNSAQSSTTASTEPVKISLITADGGRVWKEDSAVIKEVEKRTNVKLEASFIPAGDFKNKYSVLAASGTLPDISCLGNFDFQSYADQGLYMDVKELVQKHAPNLLKYIKEAEWNIVKYKGKQFAIPYINVPGKTVPVVRQDWLDNLGLKMPTTLDEYENMLKQFTYNDPDKNGKNDTYGIGSTTNGVGNSFDMVYGAYGFQKGQNYLKGDKIYPANISNEYKKALEYVNKLWEAKVFDPDLFIIKSDQARQRMAQGKAGSFTAWWSTAPQVLVKQLKIQEINPSAKLTPIVPAVKGPDGKSGMPSSGNIGGTRVVSAKSKNPEAAIKFLDFFGSDEGFELTNMGIKGVHYNDPIKGRTEEGQKAFEEKWLDSLAQVIARRDILDNWESKTEDPVKKEDVRYQQVAAGYNLYSDILYGVPVTDEEKSLGADLVKYEDDMLIKFVTGQEPLSKWDEYVSNWISKGGKKILEARIKKYNELFNKNYSSGV